ncbi:hypothetical protein BBJ28_00014223 [Nothophytophthora sp. Chile5]|nr:hypothetical protein BBJ28_00014223 [Nothophytophthora sp. Chile5]
MNKVHVIVVPSENEALSQPGELKTPPTKSFVGWIPIDYLVGQLKQDVAHYWQLKASKYELYDPQDTLLADDLHLEAANLHHPAILTFKKREHTTPSSETKPTGIQSRLLDPFWLHQQLLELFSYYALQNRHGKALQLTSYQFKHILQKATASTIFQKKRKLEFEKRATLIFRGALATPGSSGGSFDEFLDALVDVACFMFPKEASKELALEKLATQYVIPYHEREQRIGGSNAFSWTQLADLLAHSKVRSVMQRFARPLNDLATAYSSNVGLAHRRCVLKYPEFHRFLRDMIPKTVHITSSELCKVFMHSSRVERCSFGGEELPSSSETGKLEVTCAKMMDVVGYLALLAIPRLVKAKEKASADLTNVFLTGKLAVQAVKALLHHISNHLSAKSSSYMKKNAEFSRARVQFLLEFNKMHREDALLDYQSGCSALLRELPPKATSSSSNIPIPTQVLNQNELELDVEFSWDLGSTNEEEVEGSDAANDSDSSDSSPASRTSVCPLDSQSLIDLRRRELEAFTSIADEADEIYAFLAGELQRHALVRRPDTPDTVPHMLDIWVSAGEKYSEVINHVESPSLLRANLLARFGRSLSVFATQVLKSATKVYSYEELLYVTNARVYSVSSELWQDEAASFTLDLAVETLSLASGKLTQASDELSALVISAKVNDLQIPSDDDEVSSASTGGEDDEEEAEPASALYERYLCCLFHRANCLAAYADVLAHNKRVAVDFELACCFEDAAQPDDRPSKAEIFFTSVIVLAKTSPPGAFYWEAKKMYRFLLQHSKGGPNVPRGRLQHNLAMVQFKLATHLPRGCDSEKRLLENALHNLDACGVEPSGVDASVLVSKREYIRAILVVRHKFFLAESVATPAEASEGLTQEQDDQLAPFYRFVLAAAFGEFDLEKKGVILQPELSLLSKTCGYGAVSNDAMQWLLENFEHQEDGLTERGVLQYFGWLAEAGLSLSLFL